MKVYRVLEKAELKKILEGKVDELGSLGKQYENNNTHRYKENTKYIHFFWKKKYCDYLPRKDNNKELFLCTFDIPLAKLITSSGVGYYYSLNEKERRGFYPVTYNLREFAIEASKFKTSWFVDAEKLPKLKEEDVVHVF